jgi:hypothetical protein
VVTFAADPAAGSFFRLPKGASGFNIFTFCKMFLDGKTYSPTVHPDGFSRASLTYNYRNCLKLLVRKAFSDINTYVVANSDLGKFVV